MQCGTRRSSCRNYGMTTQNQNRIYHGTGTYKQNIHKYEVLNFCGFGIPNQKKRYIKSVWIMPECRIVHTEKNV